MGLEQFVSFRNAVRALIDSWLTIQKHKQLDLGDNDEAPLGIVILYADSLTPVGTNGEDPSTETS